MVFTWNEAGDSEDDEAEQMVARPEMVVRPFLDEDEQEEMGSREKEKEEGRRRAKGRKDGWIRKQEIIVLAGVVVAVGIAVAVYQNQRGTKAGEQWFGRGRPGS